MTALGTVIAALLAAVVVAVAGDSGGSASAPRTALVVDAAAGREGRELVDPRLRGAGAEVRLPRTEAEALTDVRYLAARGYRLVVTGPDASAAADTAGISAVRSAGLDGALTAAGR